MIDRNRFEDNATGFAYGGPYSPGNPQWTYLNATFTNNVFLGNNHGMLLSAYGVFETLQFVQTILHVVNNTFVDNLGTGLVMNFDGLNVYASGTVANNLLVGNEVAITSQPDVETDLAANLYFENTAAMLRMGSWNIPTDLVSIAEINALPKHDPAFPSLAGDPRFVDRGASDLHLRTDSPAIDRGDGSAAPLADFDGEARPQDGDGDGMARVDIGADEVPAGIRRLLRVDSIGSLWPRPDFATIFPLAVYLSPATALPFTDEVDLLDDASRPLVLYGYDRPGVFKLIKDTTPGVNSVVMVP